MVNKIGAKTPQVHHSKPKPQTPKVPDDIIKFNAAKSSAIKQDPCLTPFLDVADKAYNETTKKMDPDAISPQTIGETAASVTDKKYLQGINRTISCDDKKCTESFSDGSQLILAKDKTSITYTSKKDGETDAVAELKTSQTGATEGTETTMGTKGTEVDEAIVFGGLTRPDSRFNKNIEIQTKTYEDDYTETTGNASQSTGPTDNMQLKSTTINEQVQE